MAAVSSLYEVTNESTIQAYPSAAIISSRDYQVKSVLRATQIIKAFRSKTEILDLKTITSRVGFTKPTTFRLIETLVAGGLAHRIGKSGYRLQIEILNEKRFRIGYGVQSSVIPFTSTVTQSLLSAAAAANVDLVTLDNNFSARTAVLNAERFLAEKVDLVIGSQIDPRAATQVAGLLADARVPFIAIDVPHPGAVYFGADHYKAGRLAGACLGKWSVQHWPSQVDEVLLIGADCAGPTLNIRLNGMLDGITQSIQPSRSISLVRMDTKGQYERTLDSVRKHLRRGKLRKVLVGAVNDTSALAALQAFRDIGAEDFCAVAGQDACIDARNEMRRPHTRMICSVAYFPEAYGERLIKLALEMLRHNFVPPAIFVKHELVTSANVDRVYPYDKWGGSTIARIQ
ncbi:MAG: substrate-binding domain-containing protein [Silvibacterium sp.]